MTLQTVNIFALSYAEEAQFSQESLSGYKTLRLVSRPQVTTEVGLLEDGERSFKLTRKKALRGAKSGKMSFTLYLAGSGTAAGNNIPTEESETSQLMLACGMKAVFNEHKNGTLVETGSSRNRVNITDGTGNRFSAGSGIVAENGELNFVAEVDEASNPDGLICAKNWESVPSAQENLYNTRTIYPAKEPSDLALLKTFTFRLHTPSYTLKLLGACVSDFTVNGSAGDLATVTFDVIFNEFEFDSAIEPDDLEALANPLKALGAPLFYGDVDTPTAAFSFQLGNRIEERKAVGAPQGREGWFISDRLSKFTLQSYYTLEHHNDWLSGEEKSIMLCLGTAAGNVFGIFIPNGDVRVTGRPERSGLEGETIEIVAVESSVGNGDLYLTFG